MKMEITIDNYQEVIKHYINDWTWRSTAPTVLSFGKGCFVWDSQKDGENGSGMFYFRDLVKKYFPGEMGDGLQTLIDQANHDNEVVVALVYGNKAIGLRLLKYRSESENEVNGLKVRFSDPSCI
jgi:hypothetical protein